VDEPLQEALRHRATAVLADRVAVAAEVDRMRAVAPCLVAEAVADIPVADRRVVHLAVAAEGNHQAAVHRIALADLASVGRVADRVVDRPCLAILETDRLPDDDMTDTPSALLVPGPDSHNHYTGTFSSIVYPVSTRISNNPNK